MTITLNELRETAKLFTYYFMQAGQQKLAIKKASFTMQQQQGNKLVNIEIDTTDGTVSNQYRYATLEKEISEKLTSSETEETGNHETVGDKATVLDKVKKGAGF